ncbi:XylR N-terminal domain-containing protein [Metabacillus litoralis]|jgi:PucR family transcriptional regulator, purine catabolism regulatory protein|uniref:XylR N-terminal domain-containing protein n=1 Tax=Metabacillus litoralis TaxID=152268 RepID=UPI002040F421|nr:XylR N-terminal domain-containing protein [Metabacillus litoralis]MCM3652528.1 XylR N-terminal domain-containing protein [Metabacillus litoralis]
MKINFYDESISQNLVVNDRKIVFPSSAFGILRKELVRNIGIDRLKGFLFHFGWETGVNDAKEALKKGLSLEYMIKYGPILHINNGHIRGIRHECNVELDENHNILSYFSTGTWIDSYEAEEHIKQLGKSTSPVCHTLIGYSSGFMSTVGGEPLLAKEVTCVGKGDSECSWILRTQKEWESEMQDELPFYNETPIVKELEYTYEQMLEQKNFVTRLADFQKKITEEITNGSNLQTIANMVYDIVQLPIIIEDIDHQTITYSGLSEVKYLELKDDMEQYIQENAHENTIKRKEKSLLPFRKKTIKTLNQERLVTPILVQKEVLGYCSFIYEERKNDKYEEDYLFLDRFANAASLILLNEKTKFESFERMKGNFLEQILDGQFTASELIKRGKYTGLDLGQPYYITVMDYKKSQTSIEEEFLLQEKIFDTTFRYFSEKKHNILVCQRDGKMILFITNETLKKPTIYDVMENFHDFMIVKYPQGDFKFGISNVGDGIKHAAKYYEEAMIALRLTGRKKIVPFKTLGIVGVLINSKNISGIKMTAEQELGPLYKMTDPKTKELLKTLYNFLLNGGKLEQTMSDLSLSMSGLRHRINKIESLLEKDLRDPNETHQLLLILKSLIVLGELDIE